MPVSRQAGRQVAAVWQDGSHRLQPIHCFWAAALQGAPALSVHRCTIPLLLAPCGWQIVGKPPAQVLGMPMEGHVCVFVYLCWCVRLGGLGGSLRGREGVLAMSSSVLYGCVSARAGEAPTCSDQGA
jgi:hypothetical protein